MIVERFTWKSGRGNQAVELLEAERERISGPVERIYTSWMGPSGMVAVELGFENMEAHAKFWEDWSPQPDAQEWLEKFTETIDTGVSHELWFQH